MSWFWKSKKEEEKKTQTTIISKDEAYCTPMEGNVKLEPLESPPITYNDVINKYTVEAIQEKVKIEGERIWADIEKCHEAFCDYYFIDTEDEKELKELKERLCTERRDLESLGLKKSSNYTSISEKINNIERILGEQKILVQRKTFKLHCIDEARFLSFQDFITILKTYNYDIPKSISQWSREISENTLNLLKSIKEEEKDIHHYIYMLKTQPSNRIEAIIGRQYQSSSYHLNSLYVLRGIGYSNGSDNFSSSKVEFKNVLPVIENVQKYGIYKDMPVDDYLLVPIIAKWNNDFETSTYNRKLYEQRYLDETNTLFKKHVQLIKAKIEKAKELLEVDKKNKTLLICVESNALDPATVLYIESSNPNNKPLIFQTWCDGVIVYGFLE